MGQTFSLGTSDFRWIREKNWLYVDKTATIELMENHTAFITFLRPRRFGKSLLLSTLFSYYDLKSANQFDKLFEELYISLHPTKERNSYYVLRLNFSKLTVETGSSIEFLFKEMILLELKKFIKYYAPENKQDKFLKDLEEKKSLGTLFEDTINNIAELRENGKVYVLIDEYDHFTNRMIFSNLEEEYKTAVRDSGYIRQFFTNLKTLTDGPVKRIFITGILPILLNDITSGFNISENVSNRFQYQGAMGFTDSDVKELLERENISRSKHFDRIKDLYNGLMFAFNADLTRSYAYNPLMVLQYVESLISSGSGPKNILSPAVLSDQNKFDYFLKNPENIQKIMRITKTGSIRSSFEGLLSIVTMINPKHLATILFHFGLLTFKEFTTSKEVIYKIPNEVSTQLYDKYFIDYLQDHTPSLRDNGEIYEITKSVYNDGDLKRLTTYLQDELFPSFSFRDTLGLSEQSIKFVLIMFFRYTSYYEVITERESRATRNQGGYVDLLLLKSHPEVQVEWLIELKYVKKSVLKMEKEGKSIGKDAIFLLPKVQAKIKEGKEQIERYIIVNEKKHRNLESTTQMKYAVILFVGKEFVFFEKINA